LFGNDQPTPFDLRFRLAGIPVRVSPWFWIVMALFGSNLFNSPKYGPLYLLLWLACGFVSVLIHEMGHAVAAKFYGSPVTVTLIAFGGVAQYSYPPRSAIKRIVIALAGPAAGFGLLGIVVLVRFALIDVPLHPAAEATLWFLFIMNLVWNLFNLLPIWPLDGGRVCRELFALAKLRNPDAAVHTTSMVFAGVLVALGLAAYLNIGIPGLEGTYLEVVQDYLHSSPIMMLWMGLFAFTNYQMLQAVQRRGYYYEDDETPPWRRN